MRTGTEGRLRGRRSCVRREPRGPAARLGPPPSPPEQGGVFSSFFLSRTLLAFEAPQCAVRTDDVCALTRSPPFNGGSCNPIALRRPAPRPDPPPRGATRAHAFAPATTFFRHSLPLGLLDMPDRRAQLTKVDHAPISTHFVLDVANVRPAPCGPLRVELAVRPREVVDALKGRQPSKRTVSTEAIVGLERGR